MLSVKTHSMLLVGCAAVVTLFTSGCQPTTKTSTRSIRFSETAIERSKESQRRQQWTPRGKLASNSEDRPIRAVRCLYTKRPWLNLDAAGDPNPEGIHYKVFLDDGTGPGVWRDGTFHIEMYLVDYTEEGEITRDLASDWHYPSSRVPKVEGIAGQGYHLYLRWATKSIAGKNIEVITSFEPTGGAVVRSGTKGFEVPRYGPRPFRGVDRTVASPAPRARE